MSCPIHYRASSAAAVTLLIAGVVLAAGPASAAVCVGQPPWINEVDYDSYDSFYDNDRDEFVEIAAPAGTDLGGYQILAIEGNDSFFTCGTGFGTDDGDAYFNAVIPAGSVVGDDTGTGIGFFVVCFTFTSTDVGAACDVILPGDDFDSNLRNGKLLGISTQCPDGVLMLDPSDALVDAVSWEGIIPNKGDYGALFHSPNPSYNAGRDPGWAPEESLHKITSDPWRATSGSEWELSGGWYSATPGSANPGQSFVCDPPDGAEDFVAYNDGAYDAASDGQDTDPQGQSVHYTSPDVTYLSIGAVNHGGSQGPSSGYLIDKASGDPTSVTAALTESGGVVWQPWILPDNPDGDTWNGGYDADAGTDARNTFGGIVDMVGTTYYGASGWYVDLTFSGLKSEKKYTFATSSTRGNPAYTNRFSQYSIIGADTYSNASTSGVTEISPDVVYYNTGDNISEGYVARWEDITAADGTFAVRVEAHPSSADGGRKAYAFDVWMLQEFPAVVVCGDGEVEGDEECDDGNTDDGDCCSATCSFEASGSPCDDDNACTDPDTCNATGGCVAGAPVDCDNGEFCDGEEYCDPDLGCQDGDPLDLSDGVDCTDDSCNEELDTIVHAPNDANCDDNQYCNGAETCDQLLDCQSGTPPDVDDGVLCTDDSCDEVLDIIIHSPNDAHCDDDLYCNGAETCDQLLDCQSGTPPVEDDGVACTDDNCVEETDSFVHIPNDALCDDSDDCTADSCDAELGCINEPIEPCGAAAVPAFGLWAQAILALMVLGTSGVLLRIRRGGFRT